MRRLLPFVLFALVIPCAVRAQEAAAVPSEAPVDAAAPSTSEPTAVEPVDPRPPAEVAREAYAEGEAHYAAGAFMEAEAAFIRAYTAVPNPVVLIGVAESRAQLGRGVAAVEIFERYLRVRPNADDADAVRARIEALRDTPGRVHIETDPVGATITIDGEETGLVTPADVELPPGRHLVRVSLEGYEPIEGELRVEFASRYDVRQTLGVTPPPVPDEAAEGELEDEPEPEPDRLPAPVIAMMSTAAGTLVVGAALGFTALSRESDYNRAPSVATADEGKRFAMFADIALGVSLAATTTSVVLYLTSRPAAEDDADDDAPLEPSIAPTVMVAPVLGRGAGGGVVTVRF